MSGEAPGTMRAALAWLAHPVSVVALVVLVVNDHVLKAAFGGWWTGKLSDAAGLVFFPALVAVVLAGAARLAGGMGGGRRDGGRRDAATLHWAALATTGVGFVWVKATWAGAAAASAVLTALTGPLLGGPSLVRADATDLLALPALGLAAWVAAGARAAWGARAASGARSAPERRGHVSGGDRRRRARKALGVALVPVAILASVATGPGARPEASVVEDGAGGWVVVAGGCEQSGCYGMTEYRRTDYGWMSVGEPQSIGVPVTLACSEAQPDECFRTVPGKMAVEQSHDGGRTWKKAWAASADDLRALRDAYLTLGTGQEDHLQSAGVGVFDGDDGMTVVVGNRVDGLLVRGPDGHWERVAFEGLSCCDDWKLVPLPTRWMPYGATEPPAIAWGTAALLIAGTATILVADRRVRRASGGAAASRGRWALGFALGASVAAGMAAIVTGPLGATGSRDPYAFDSLDLTVFIWLPLALVLAAIAFGLASGWRRHLWWRLWLLALAVAVAVGAAVFVVPGAGWWDLFVAAAVGAACVWATGRLLAARGTGWGFAALVDPPPWAPANPLGAKAVLPGAASAGADDDPDDDTADDAADADASAEWTEDDALVLQCVGRSWAEIPLQSVLAEAFFLTGSYPSMRQLEVSLGKLEASGLVKVVRPSWFRGKREGRALLRQARRLAARPREARREAVLEALRAVPCVRGTLSIGQEAYDRAMRRHLET